LKQAIADIGRLREEFWHEVFVPEGDAMNGELEKANRVADFLELGELMCRDALERRESCGGHFREEFQTEDGEAKRDDANFCHVAAWEYQGEKAEAKRNVEPLHFENVELATRSYK
jgi:succinate dehydrogenase / fumarate reductase flavoprotein subunit